jgi:hypothetical protein
MENLTGAKWFRLNGEDATIKTAFKELLDTESPVVVAYRDSENDGINIQIVQKKVGEANGIGMVIGAFGHEAKDMNNYRMAFQNIKSTETDLIEAITSAEGGFILDKTNMSYEGVGFDVSIAVTEQGGPTVGYRTLEDGTITLDNEPILRPAQKKLGETEDSRAMDANGNYVVRTTTLVPVGFDKDVIIEKTWVPNAKWETFRDSILGKVAATAKLEA